MSVLQYINKIPDFPKKSITFLDISPILKNYFNEFITECADEIAQIENIDYFVGIEARGFILASALAERFQKGIIMIRKKGKLPPETLKQSYELEYGSDVMEMHKGHGSVCIIDDILATGGTLEAACTLTKECGYTIVDVFTAINLTKLNNFTINGNKCKSLLEIDN